MKIIFTSVVTNNSEADVLLDLHYVKLTSRVH